MTAPALSPDAADSLAPFVAAGLLEPADAHVARAIARLAPGTDPAVALAAALVVRATRLGHVCLRLEDVPGALVVDEDGGSDVTSEVARLPWPEPREWLAVLRASAAVARGDHAPGRPVRPLVLDGTRAYLERYWRYERTVGADLLARAAVSPGPPGTDALPAGLLDRRFGPAGAAADPQRRAAEAALGRRLAVIAGGPGTGKTRTVARFLAVAHQAAHDAGRTVDVALAAPTGKAAARLTESVRAEAGAGDLPAEVADALRATEASTIHRLLGPTGGLAFRHGRDDPLPADVVVVDEASMVSLPLMARLLAAVRPDARVVLVGDPYQLASIEAGAVLGDVAGPAADPTWSGRLPLGPLAGSVVVLERAHRFAGDSTIASLADAVRTGDADGAVELLRTGGPEVLWATPGDAESRREIDVELARVGGAVVRAALAGDRVGGLRAAAEHKVLAATRHGPLGSFAWRDRIERLLARAEPRLRIGRRWYVGRPVIVTANDYLHALFNGDTGLVVADGDGSTVTFATGDTTRDLRPSQLSAVETWWSMTIHKSQGSEYRHVVVSLPAAPSPVLTRELFYTAVTRARERLTVVAEEASLRAAIGRPVARASGLRDRLWT